MTAPRELIALLEALFASLPIALEIHDHEHDGAVIHANRAFHEMIRVTPPEVARLVRAGVASTFGPLWIARDGGERLAIVGAVLPLGGPIAVTYRDDTAAERARELAARQGARLRSLFMQAPVAIAIQEGPDLVYTLANPIYQQLLAGQPMLGRTLREVLPEIATMRKVLERVFATGETHVGSEQRLRVIRDPATGLEDAWFNVICQATRDPSGTIDGVMTFAVEVTDQVQAVRTRDEFLSVASHELKTPVTALQLQLQLLEHHAGVDGLNDRAKGRVAGALRVVDRLTLLMDELLDVTRVSAGSISLTREPMELAAAAEEVVQRHQELLRRAGCVVTVDGEARGVWDRLRLEQVLSNLVINAAKYGAGKPIAIDVAAARGIATVRVRDQGIGIAPEDHQRIFEKFERAVSATNYGGLGLGLYITRQIVALHGGTIGVESAAGQGATFVVTLPTSG